MKKIDLGQTLGILANIGVIAGIVFLAFELRQNNELLMSQSRTSLRQARASYQEYVATNQGGIAEIMEKVGREELSGREQFQLTVHWSLVLINWDSMYREVVDGPLQESDIPLRNWAATMRNNPSIKDFWERSRDTYSPELNRYIEETVLTYFTER